MLNKGVKTVEILLVGGDILKLLWKCRFAHSYLAFLMFIPCSFFGLLIPRAISDRVSHCQGVSSKKILKVVKSLLFLSCLSCLLVCY